MEQNEIYTALPGVLLPWYEKNARDLPWRHTKEPYRVWVSEIMLQQTRVEAVIGYYERFMEAFPTVQALAEADEARVLKLWEGLGYYSRARNLQKTAKLLTETQNGAFPDTAEALEKLPGIGAYTAGAVASICFEQPAAAVDGNVLRIIMRMTADDRPIDLPQVKKEIGEALCKVYPKGHCGGFTQALMELGACVCTPKSPKCEVCPTQSFCRAYKAGNVTKYPVKRPKAAKKRQIRRGKAKRDGFARRVMAVSERTSKARCPNRRANSTELSHRPEGADARNAQDAHFHASSLGDDRLCDPLQRDVRSVYMGKPYGA